MKFQHARYSLAILASLVLVSIGTVMLDQKVNAAAEGKITGTVKLDGTASPEAY